MQGKLTPLATGLARSAAGSLLVVYCGRNAFWLVEGRIPPSLFWAVTGLPCPTTGGTRSLICLAHGDWAASLRWNPLTLPIIVLLVITLCSLGQRLWTRRPALLPRPFLLAWGWLLAIAWACKLWGDSRYW
ncbi:MAG TPA: DUF2752 domain-containing protein [Pirellulales bacterium]|nr:DUF2752 domain-containing protein [Pirellulales bacterium]